VLAGLVLAALMPAHAQTQAQERIYESRTRDGHLAYTNEAQPGSELIMQLSPLHAAARDAPDGVAASAQPEAIRSSSRAAPGPQLRSLIEQAAARHALDPALLTALIRHESGFDPMAVSRAGARGLMQLMPDTARRYGVRRMHDPGENIAAGSAYLRDMLDMFGSVELALAAYNAGEGAVRRHGNRVPPFTETLHYVSAVLAEYRLRKQPSSRRIAGG
jgi:soluble lytic murein transglycosylase-like protein